MEKTKERARDMCMTEEDLDCLEKLVLQQLHDIKEMRKSYLEACKGPKRDCKSHFGRHQESLERNAEQTLEYSCASLPIIFQTADVPGTPPFASCSRHCSEVSAETAVLRLIQSTGRWRSESADEPDKPSEKPDKQ